MTRIVNILHGGASMLTVLLRFVFLITISLLLAPPSYAEKKSPKFVKAVGSVEPDCDEVVQSSRSNDPVSAYMREIGKYKVLSPQELLAKHTALYEQEYYAWNLIKNSPFIGRFAHAWNEHFKLRPLNEKESKSEENLEEDEAGQKPTARQKAAQKTPEGTLLELNEKMEHIQLAHGDVRTVLSIALREVKELIGAASSEHASHLEHLEAELEKVIHLNLAYRNEVAEGNLRLAFNFAKKNMYRQGLRFADIIQVVNEGLLTAADKFDPERGLRFSTYANHWFRQGIVRTSINEGYTIRVPVHMRELIAKVAAAYHELRAQLNRVPTEQDVAHYLDIPVKQVARALEVVLQDKTSSLDNPTALGDGDDKLADYIPDTNSAEVTSFLEKEKEENLVREILNTLSPIEREIIERRYGLGKTEQEETLKEIGESRSLSRERIRQLEVQALSKLRRALAQKNEELASVITTTQQRASKKSRK